ncbi:ATP-binding protein [Paraburkholderia sediminicola]|uniref:ATP-binding protein n=1 Tax=Paraburkholderia sediminicola TaxID=458836 RepID=UPI0038B90CC0
MPDLLAMLQTGGLDVPWPTAVGDTIVNSRLPGPGYCGTACTKRECLSTPGTTLGQRCESGLTFYKANVNGTILTIFGVTGFTGYAEIPGRVRNYAKDDLKGRTVRPQEFSEWISRLKAVVIHVDQLIKQTTSEALHPLHDTPKLAKQILRQSEAIVSAKGGNSFDANLGRCTDQELSLYKTAQLLVDSFDMLKIFFNPESARYGNMRRMAPYKLIDKLRIIALSGEREIAKRKKIILLGNTRREYFLYDSFKVIPLTVIENALKYCFENEIKISFEDQTEGTKIEVVNVGPLIPRDEYGTIFERNRRGRYAVDRGDEGMGIGLFVAHEAARANNVTIGVDSQPLNYEMYGVPVARTTFSFVVKDARRVT